MFEFCACVFISIAIILAFGEIVKAIYDYFGYCTCLSQKVEDTYFFILTIIGFLSIMGGLVSFIIDIILM